MISVRKAKESRIRDAKRKRLVLNIGGYHFHITKNEAMLLAVQLIIKANI